MKKSLLMLILLSCVLAAAVSARDLPTATKLTGADIQQMNMKRVPGLEVGNLNPATWALSGWVEGNESYAYMFTAEDVACNVGFDLDGVHILGQFDETVVPATFDMYVTLNERVLVSPDCYAPGETLCTSFQFTITIETAGFYDIALPIDCGCAHIYDPTGRPYVYALEVHIIGALDMEIITDGVPMACTAYNDWGAGWQDLIGYFGEYGNTVMWGDVMCCDTPVSSGDKTWGEIKSMYK
jgi:hypothetical protein